MAPSAVRLIVPFASCCCSTLPVGRHVASTLCRSLLRPYTTPGFCTQAVRSDTFSTAGTLITGTAGKLSALPRVAASANKYPSKTASFIDRRIPLSAAQIVVDTHDLIRSAHDLGIDFVCPLGHHEGQHFLYQIHVRRFQETLHGGTGSVRTWLGVQR